MRMMVPNIFRKLRVGLTGLDIKLRKLIQSIPIYHFSVYNTWIKVRYDLVRQLFSSFAGLVDSEVTVLQVHLRLTVDFVAPEYTKLLVICVLSRRTATIPSFMCAHIHELHARIVVAHFLL